MKKLSILILFSVLHFHSFAQTQVKLKDGSNNLLSAHTTIQQAYDAIPATLSQPYVIEIDSSYNSVDESYPVTFINKPGASALNTITIKLESNVQTEFIADTGNRPVILFNNADWIIVDGESADPLNVIGGLIIMKTDTISYPVIEFINGSSNNLVKECVLLRTSFLGGGHIAFKGTTFADNGNSDNTIEHNHFINGALSIVSEGSITSPNHNLFIRNNTIGSTYENGLWIKQGTGKVTIENNQFLMSSTGNNTVLNAILVDNLTDTLLVRNNHINMANYDQQIRRQE